ncbi:MAG TPA: HEAT repeat domain-containing protein [Candidatus Ozemobacteraceae bacterium]|mgnify:CR=1 FL=1|nr:HEAT repeat domain-containing protein [Candidatus Ozemobacteraceae bacterium]
MNQEELGRYRQNLTSPRADVRRKAITDLRKLSGEEAIPVLISVLGERNGEVQADLTRAFLAYKDAALPYLVRALGEPSWNNRHAASRIIGALGDSALSRFLELIPKNEEDVDYWMVQTLSLMGGEATRYLIKVFGHQNPRVKLAAIRAAGNVRDPQVVPALLALLEEKGWPVRKAAYDSLTLVHDLNPDAVMKALHEASVEAKYWVIKLVAVTCDPALIPVFCEIVEKDPEESKLEAIRAIAMIETREAQKVLVGYLSHKTWIIRKTAADAIWEQGLDAGEELLSATANPNVDARYWSVRVLGRSNEPKVFGRLLDSLHDPHSSVRAAACQALGSMGDRRALPPLMELIADPSEDVRTAAIFAVSLIGDKDERIASQPSVPKHLKPENQMPCPHCQKSIGRSFTFCPFCLGHLKNACRKCGRPMEAGWKGCPDCGQPA